MHMRRGAAGLLLGIVVMLAGAQPASSASCWFGCKTPPTTKAPTPAPAAPAPAPAPAPVAVPAAFNPDSAAQRILELTNAERAAVGLPGLSMRADILGIAQGQSAAMAAAGTIWHNEQFLNQATRKALAANMLGETVGMGATVEQIHTALMLSPGHKANILEGAFSIVGMAVAKGPDGMLYLTQDFMQPSGGTPRPVAKPAAPKAAPKPRVVAAAPKPRPVSTPVPTAAPATTAPPTTEAPATTTTTAPQPDSSVLAAFDTAPLPAPAPASHSNASGATVLVAFALVAATATGALRVRLSRRA